MEICRDDQQAATGRSLHLGSAEIQRNQNGGNSASLDLAGQMTSEEEGMKVDWESYKAGSTCRDGGGPGEFYGKPRRGGTTFSSM